MRSGLSQNDSHEPLESILKITDRCVYDALVLAVAAAPGGAGWDAIAAATDEDASAAPAPLSSERLNAAAYTGGSVAPGERTWEEVG